VPEAGSIGAGSLPSVRAAAAAEAGAGTASTAPLVRLNSLGFPVGIPPGEPGEETRRFRFAPALGAELIATDNVNGSVSNRKADLITRITPSILVTADTPRLSAVATYSPSALFYARESTANRINHSGSAQALLTVIPEHFYVDVRGFAGFQPLLGGQNPQANAVSSSGSQVQSSTFLISPYYVQRFGDTATARVGYTLQQVNQSLVNTFDGRATGNGALAAGAGFQNSDFTAHQVYGVVRTGPSFGRLALEGSLDSTDYVGNGVLDGAYRRFASVEGRYAITRGVFILLGGGYEQLRYSGNPGYRVNGPTFTVGARWDIAPDSFIVARYGRREGFNSASLDASVAVGVRTRVTARYDERLGTSASRAGDLLATTTLDELGNPIDLASGLPSPAATSSSFLGVQSNLLRVKNGSLSVSQSWPRDTIGATFGYQSQSVVSQVAGLNAFSQTSYTGTLFWSRLLSERTTGTASLQYGRFTSTGLQGRNTFFGGGTNTLFGTTNTGFVGNGNSTTASLSFQHQLRERLSGTFQVATTLRTSDAFSGTVVQNLVLVGLRQTF
jgi:uncharacterized protein (PEP-CTERM system associated)